MTDVKTRLLPRVAGDLQAIETALEENLTPYLDLVSQTARHILFSGGKRLRPLLMVVSARLCGYRGDEDSRFSTLFEYLHAATLLHDDLVDGARMRRGNTVAHSLFGNETTVLTGDFLLARALTIASATRCLEVIETIARVTENMSQGEIQQLHNKGRLDLDEAEYLHVIENKTAGLMRAACRVGALIADAPETAVDRLSAYGHHLGLAFQMADDLLDYTADTRELGKVVGADLREGKLTLPVIYALRRAHAPDRREMRSILSDPEFSEADFQRLVGLMQIYGGLEYTRSRAAEHVHQAKTELQGFDASETRETLEMIADYALQRTA